MPGEEVKGNLPSRLIGKLESFIIGENFDDYLERVENFFELNEKTIDDDKQKILLLINLIGSEASTKIIKAFKPEKCTKSKYSDVIAKCKAIFTGDRNSIVEHYRFNSRNQQEGESLMDFALELQAIAEHCEFDKFLDTALRDRFVAGVKSSEIKRELLSLDSKTKFGVMVEKAKKEELIRREAEQMGNSENPKTSVNRLQREAHKGSTSSFYRGRSRNRKNNDNASDKRWKRRSTSAEMNSDKRNVRCYRCQAMGHYSYECEAKVPRLLNRNQRTRSDADQSFPSSMANQLSDLQMDDEEEEYDNQSEFLASILGNSLNSIRAAFVELPVESKTLLMEVDTGSCVSVCNYKNYKKHFADKKIFKSNLKLSVVTSHTLKLVGKIKVKVFASSRNHDLWLHIIDTPKEFVPLLGRDWLDCIVHGWRQNFKINLIDTEDESFRKRAIREIKIKYAKLFDDNLTVPIKNFVVDVKMDPLAKPFVHKAYTVPFNVRDRVCKHLDDMEKAGIIEKIEYTEWASPIVVVVKPNKELRICMDGSVTVNPHIETHHYPLPLIDELISNKDDAKIFAVLDLKGAYQQLLVSENTKKLLAINTNAGVKPAASIFQSILDKILQGIDKVQAFIDDILIWAKNQEELNERIIEVLERLRKFNVKVNLGKCQWFVKKVTYLGHELSEAGIAPNKSKTKALSEAPEPRNVSEVRSFVGMINFFAKFLPKLNMKMAPLYDLMKKEAKWEWTDECRTVFNDCKTDICSDKLLVHYDPKKPILVTCDACDRGIAGVLSHRINGEEHPVFFVSRSLTAAEKKYPILHREALAIVFTMEKFYKYVFGRFVEVFTDHKPLEGIFKGRKGEPPIVANRLQRYIHRMAIFDYKVTYKKGLEIGHADCLSRLPINEKPSLEDENESKICSIRSVESDTKILNAERIKEETENDPILNQVYSNVLNGWHDDDVKPELKHFYLKNRSLGVEQGCLIYGERTVIPKTLQNLTLSLLHANHIGIVKMKQVARELVYWEGIDRDIEHFIKSCEACQILHKDKPDKEYGKWPETSHVFERVHLDFFHFQGNTFLILIDAFSRWIEIKRMKRTTAQALSNELNDIFAIFGTPVTLVTDNGPPFNSHEFANYCEIKDIKKMHSPPYHPQSNGLAERAVQTTKAVLRKFIYESNNQSLQIDKVVGAFLKNYNNLQCADGVVPAHRMFSFKPRNELRNLKIVKFINSNEKQIETKSPKVEFKENENVLYITQLKGYSYSYHAKIVKKLSSFVYRIIIEGNFKLAHINQLRKSILKNFVDRNVRLTDEELLELQNRKKVTPKKKIVKKKKVNKEIVKEKDIAKKDDQNNAKPDDNSSPSSLRRSKRKLEKKYWFQRD